MTTTVEVAVPGRSYEVHIGAGASKLLAGAVAATGARRAAVVTQAGVPAVVDPGVDHETFVLPAGEAAKSLASVEELCRGFARMNLTRSDVVVAVGGGVVTDTAGFAAASWHRGTPVIHIPTTLLAQVDAAIGGKTGVNLPEGKNLVGAFWQPAAVLCDTDLLKSLPEREWRSGLGEVVKCDLLGAGSLAGAAPEEMVAACARLKAEIVASDEREGAGRRDLLNYGHTLAHALETAGGYDLRHGEAVVIGLAFAAHLARHLGRITEARVGEIRRTIDAYGLPLEPPVGLELDETVDLMQRDKKAQTDGLRFVLDGPNGVETAVVETAEVRTALAEFIGAGT